MNDPTGTTSPVIPRRLAATCWLGALLTVAGALAAAFSAYTLVATVLLLPGAFIVLSSALNANKTMQDQDASEEYRNEKDRLFLAVYGPAMVLGILMFVIAVIAQLLQIVNLPQFF